MISTLLPSATSCWRCLDRTATSVAGASAWKPQPGRRVSAAVAAPLRKQIPVTRALRTAAIACAFAAAVQAEASVLLLHDEALNGDLAGQLFELPTGLSSVKGVASASWAPGGGAASDNDQFRFTLPAGQELVGVTVQYRIDATTGNARSAWWHGLRPANGDWIATESTPYVGSGYEDVEALFDEPGGFVPLSAATYNFFLGFDTLGFAPNSGDALATTYNDRWVLTFEVQPVGTAAVPTPATLPLVALATLAAAWASRSAVHRRSARQTWATGIGPT